MKYVKIVAVKGMAKDTIGAINNPAPIITRLYHHSPTIEIHTMETRAIIKAAALKMVKNILSCQPNVLKSASQIILYPIEQEMATHKRKNMRKGWLFNNSLIIKICYSV